MEGQAQELWSQCLERFSASLHRQSYDTWFQPCRGLSVSETTFEVEAPNRFAADWLRDHYAALVEDAIREVAQRPLVVTFVYPAAPDRIETTPYPSAIAPPVGGGNVGGGNGGGPERVQSAEPVAVAAVPAERERGQLDPRYTFSNFVVGGGNRFAYAACVAVAEAPARTYNPLFIYGGVGLGKTHLMQGIGSSARAAGTAQRICYVSAETFMNEMIYAIQHGKTFEFRKKYREVDLLLVDDIQFLAGKESTQEEFFHTFNSLYAATKQIVITSDRAPKEIATLEERLVSRFQWGLICDIQAPDLETRVAILRHKAERDGLTLPNEVLLLIAKSARSNIRELEGALVKLIAYSSITGRDVTPALAEEVLKDFLAPTTRRVTVEDVQRAVSSYFRLPLEAMRARRRTTEVAMPRQIAMYLTREHTSLSLADIGARFGGRDHTTVIHACDKITKGIERDRELRGVVDRIAASLDGATPPD
jgi:chromosomal replication initiator protein